MLNSAVLITASGLPINVEGHSCKMLTVQAVPTAQCLRLGPTESACQSFSAVRYTIDAHNYAKRYDFVCVTTQTRSIAGAPLTGNFHGDNARTVWRAAGPRLTRFRGSTRLAELTLLVEHMPILVCSSVASPFGGSRRVHVRWETQPRVLWNEQEHKNEEHELVY